VKPGASLVDIIRDAEKAQRQDVHVSVTGQDCPGAYVEVAREAGIPYIRVTEAQPSNPSSEPGYSETGYSIRDQFERALSERLPPFYSCKQFRFRFGRAQMWPTSDSFTVRVDAGGIVAAVSELKQDDVAE
jgi:hypothetical protein